MRRSSVFSLIIAVALAAIAVFGARGWLDLQRANILAANQPEKIRVDQIVVAGNALRFGDRLTAGKLKLINWPAGAKPVGAFASIEEVVGTNEDDARFVMSAIEPDEPVLSSKITMPGQRAKLSSALAQDMKAVSIRVNDVLGVAGFVLPGDRVDIMLTRRNRKNRDQTYVDVLLQGVKVLAIDQSADDRRDEATVVRTITFEVSTAEAQKLTLAANVGTLSLALRNIASSGFESIDRVTLRDLGGGELSKTLVRDVIKEHSVDPGYEIITGDINVDTATPDEQIVAIKPAPSVEPKSRFAIVGVTRSGKRSEYRFEVDEN